VNVKVARVLVACVLLVGVLFLAATASEQKVMQVRIYPADKSQVKEILGMGLDIAYVRAGEYIDIITDQQEWDRLISLGFDARVVHSDLVAFYQSRLEKEKDMGGYHTYSEVMVALDSMHTLYPSITTAKMDIGHSLEDSVIWAIKISDNPAVDEDEPEVFFNSLIHAREPAGMEVLLYFMWYLLDNYGTDPVATHLVNDRELWFVPVVNPEGYCYNEYQHPGGGGMWRKNRRDCGPDYGVDLNRNWGYMWGYDNSGSSPYCDDEDYRGTGPFSEPTTQAIRDFINGRDFVMCLDNHAWGMWLIYPWCYDRLYTPDHNLFLAITDSMAAFNGHTPGTAWETVNYPVNGGSVDWEYGEAGIIAVSPEIGNEDDGFWPPPSRILPLCQLELPANLLYAELADNPRRILPPDAPTLASIDSVLADYTVRWSHQDTLNPAVAFELMEMTGFERFSEDLEDGYSDWDLQGFSVSTSRSHSPTHSFYSGQGNHLNNKVTSLSSTNVQAGDSLEMWCWYDIENNWDYAYVEISTDGGASFFSIPGNITTTYNPYGANLGHGITGSSAGWVLGKFSLSSYVGQQIYVRLHYVTDSWTYEEGFYADDIYPSERYASMVSLSDAIVDTFYQITGQEDGTYDYKVRAKDQQNQWGAWSNVETAVVSVEQFIRGDANGDGTITLSDAVFLINYLYKNGPVPDPPAAGDANSDGQTDLGDVVYLLNYLYKGGPPPQK
jgi:hypothetical protein